MISNIKSDRLSKGGGGGRVNLSKGMEPFFSLYGFYRLWLKSNCVIFDMYFAGFMYTCIIYIYNSFITLDSLANRNFNSTNIQENFYFLAYEYFYISYPKLTYLIHEMKNNCPFLLTYVHTLCPDFSYNVPIGQIKRLNI